jgi:hypothetical protein
MGTNKSKSEVQLMPAVRVAAVMSFLKDTRGLESWTSRELAETLGISTSEAGKVITLLQLQGYVKAAHPAREWFTTAEGHAVSGSKLPHFTRERVDKALHALKESIAAARKDFKSPYKLSAAVAFGDFLRGDPRVQAPDVGVLLEKRKADHEARISATESKSRMAFLKQLRGKNVPLNLLPYEEWMGKRSHQKLI